MNELETRIAMLEKTVQALCELPQLSHLGATDAERFRARLLMSIAHNEQKLSDPNISNEERKIIEAQITKFQHLVAPMISLMPRDNA